MTVYVGVDIAKELHYAAIMKDDGVVSNPFSFENNDKGFQSLLSHLAPFEKESVLVGYESTAHYQENLAYFLKREGYRTAELNPLQTSALRKANIRNTKTDRVDAKLICLTLAQHNAALSGRDVSRLDDLYGLFAAYYAKKISEGKSHYQALGHCAKKLVKSIFHVLKYNEAFNLA